MRSPKEHLAYLLELAAQPGARQELVRELADLLTAWPANYPAEVRASFAALLARAEHDIDPEARRELALRLVDCADAPLGLLNEFFFEIPLASRGKVLQRDALIETPVIVDVDEAALVETVRNKRAADLADALARAFKIDTLTASEILQDGSGAGVAIACRGAGLSRAAYSALTVLAARSNTGARLRAFDAVPERGAATMLTFWRRQATLHAHPQAA
ncbi:MAG TPA: hypothetical protein VHL34_02170 [Rhizomicrobium sp.]|jgi:uncharacterized protein (DUF2336 family)|nr:hypothetical protein [Rhizomicrobium sp.]